jgi:hypothetical protein
MYHFSPKVSSALVKEIGSDRERLTPQKRARAQPEAYGRWRWLPIPRKSSLTRWLLRR